MAEVRINLYEGLFLLNQQAAASDFGACVEFTRQVFRRAEAEVLVLRKWDDRKLAYEVRGQKRGVYLLAYFKARSAQIANIVRDCNLSEQVLRCLITKADHIGDAEIEVARKDADLTLEAKLRGSDDRGGRREAEPADAAARTPREEPAPPAEPAKPAEPASR